MTAPLSAPAGATGSTRRPRAVNFRQLLSTRLTRLAGDAIARAIHKDESAASRIVSGERGCTLDEWCALMELADVKVVDINLVCVDPRALESLTYLAQKAMSDPGTAKKLIWEDDQA